MKVQFEDKTFLLSFSHERPEDVRRKGYRTTTCMIKLVTGPTPRESEIYATGLATCGPSDQFCKEIGRRLSLTRATSGFRKPVSLPAFQDVAAKAIREEVWKTYLNRKKHTIPVSF